MISKGLAILAAVISLLAIFGAIAASTNIILLCIVLLALALVI